MNITNLILIINIILLLVLISLLLKSRKKTPKGDDALLNIILNQNNDTRKELTQILENQRRGLSDQIQSFDQRLMTSLDQVENKSDKLTQHVNDQLEKIREDNEKRLESIRTTVDQKLTTTLNTRLGESFKVVSNQLEVVHHSLGEMKELANDVGNLSRILMNVKIRGTWGEYQLENILEQILIPSQWEKNVITRKSTNNRVEFAIILPGKGDFPIYLPIDSKFPKEDYERLQEYQVEGDKDKIALTKKAIATRIQAEAKDIYEKYIDPPHTTEFAILFLPIEGLFAEVLSINGLIDKIQRDYKVVVSGPTTFAALLNSLQMGFKTLAIERRSEEVWNVLSSVKSEFQRFTIQIDKVQQKLNQASTSLDKLGTRTRVMKKKLNLVDDIDGETIEDNSEDNN
ncbi:MAG: DNA recombination protein RmuC [Sphaerochaetaceae bacterium]|nr:DNA recombination protein RmuC [Sphaerochaetaceae bacterium]